MDIKISQNEKGGDKKEQIKIIFINKKNQAEIIRPSINRINNSKEGSEMNKFIRAVSEYKSNK